MNDKDSISIKEIILKLKEWISFFQKSIVIIFCFTLIGAILGITYTYQQKPIYYATLSFVVEDEKANNANSGLAGAMGLASQFGLDVGNSSGGSMFSGNNLMELMKSRALIEKALLNSLEITGQSITYAQYYLNLKRNEKDINQIFFFNGVDRTSFSRKQDSVLERIYSDIFNRLSIALIDKKASIIKVTYKDSDEFFAKKFTENLVNEVSQFYVETKSKKAKTNVALLQHQTDSIRRELNQAMTGVAIANDNTYNLNPALNVQRVTSAKRQIDVQANSALLTQLIASLEIAKSNLRRDTPLIQIIDSPIFPLKKVVISKFKALLIGGVIGFLLIILLLAVRKLFKDLINE